MIPTVSHLTEGGATAESLSVAEVAEMKEHLAFLRSYKDSLRLRLNATEDLLVNGRREPTDRGVCRHLLGKVDRSVIEAAVGREPLRSDPAARARMLAGAIRLTADIGVLLAYLETLAHVRSHAEAAQAFAEVVRRIDFESLSATRLARLLHVLTETFVGQERVQVLFSLLAQPAFRRAFDAAAPALPREVAEIFAPLRAVHRRLLEDATASEDLVPGTASVPASSDGDPVGPQTPSDSAPTTTESVALLAAGMEQVLSAPDPVLRSYAESLRGRMLELALQPGVPAALADRAAGVLLSSLARSGRAYTRLATRRAAQLLQRHADDRARAVLEELRRAEPGYRLAERWLAALDGRRVGRIALRGSEPVDGRLAAGVWLDAQRPVWVRTAPASAAERLAGEARLQATLALPCVASVVEHGVASGIPYVAVSGPGQPLAIDPSHPLDIDVALPVVAAVARVLRALALAAIALPDAAPARFLYVPQGPFVTLADLDGAESAAAEAAAARHAALTRNLARALLSGGAAAGLSSEIGESLTHVLAGAGDLVELVGVLDRAALHAVRA